MFSLFSECDTFWRNGTISYWVRASYWVRDTEILSDMNGRRRAHCCISNIHRKNPPPPGEFPFSMVCEWGVWNREEDLLIYESRTPYSHELNMSHAHNMNREENLVIRLLHLETTLKGKPPPGGGGSLDQSVQGDACLFHCDFLWVTNPTLYSTSHKLKMSQELNLSLSRFSTELYKIVPFPKRNNTGDFQKCAQRRLFMSLYISMSHELNKREITEGTNLLTFEWVRWHVEQWVWILWSASWENSHERLG